MIAILGGMGDNWCVFLCQGNGRNNKNLDKDPNNHSFGNNRDMTNLNMVVI